MTDYWQLGFLVGCDASPNGLLRRDESRGYAGNLFRVSRRTHDNADAMAGRGHHWRDESGSHRDHAANRMPATALRSAATSLERRVPAR